MARCNMVLLSSCYRINTLEIAKGFFMKLITLNIWGGFVQAALLEFFKDNQTVDVFCLQEVYHNAPKSISTEERKVSLEIFNEIQAQLPNHRGYFKPVVAGIYGLAIFARNNIKILAEGEAMIYENTEYPGYGPKHSRIIQWLECIYQNKKYNIFNVHGLWNGLGKTDTDERLLQSQNIKSFVDSFNNCKILCGDFNLRPDTESLKIISEGMIDLIDEHHIQCTRTSFYPKAEKFADYIFTSKDIQVNQFAVLPDEVSDHAPLLIDFD